MKRLLGIGLLTAIFIFSSLVCIENSSAIGDSMSGLASWYCRRDRGIRKTTANMERFDDTKLTCAMWGVPFNTILQVTNLDNGKSVTVRVNDRGPAKRLVRRGRIIDLTKEAFSKISHPKKGLISVSVTVLSQS
ncbi:MAG: septal ring lytic transglycosylase RlpA family protein [Candidatus Omnitrophota bacterium]|nr:septal ring lytic transglycosylase RlpA family protein [Candidatus Omnitrophota bacterium]